MGCSPGKQEEKNECSSSTPAPAPAPALVKVEAEPKPKPIEEDKSPEINESDSEKYIKNASAITTLRKAPLLTNLSDEEADALANLLEKKEFRKGEIIIKFGDLDHAFYLIEKGAVESSTEVSSTSTENHKEQKQNQLKIINEGDVFGITTLFRTDAQRICYTAIEDTICLSIDRDAFVEFVHKRRFKNLIRRPAVSAETVSEQGKPSNITSTRPRATTQNERVYRTAAARAAHLSYNRYAISSEAFGQEDKMPSIEDIERRKTTKPDVTKQMIQTALTSNILLKTLTTEQCRAISNEMWRVECSINDNITTQGEDGDEFFVIDSGTFDVYITHIDSEKQKINTMGSGTCLGELALMYNSPRTATVQATSDAVLWCIDRLTFRRILKETTEKRVLQYQEFLKQVDILRELPPLEIEKLAFALEDKKFSATHRITVQGFEGRTFYFVKKGEIVVKKSEHGEPEHEINRIHAGQYFGDLALLRAPDLSKNVRTATTIAVTDVEVLALEALAFNEILGPLKNIFLQRANDFSDKEGLQKELIEAALERDKPIDAPRKMLDISLDDLKVVGLLGRGKYGLVQLVQDVKNDAVYALKKISKDLVVNSQGQGHILSEKFCMSLLDNNFLVKLYATLKNDNCIYFLMEACLGGELLTIVPYFDINNIEGDARFYAGCIALALEAMHLKHIVYRDLKPENVVLDSRGYAKITDFGFAKKLEDRTYTLCGTPEYLAPEVLAGCGHTTSVDWWTLGILIYEMLTCETPFYAKDHLNTYRKIAQHDGKVRFPQHIPLSEEAIDLITQLLHPKPHMRATFHRVKKHPWFKNFDWDTLKAGTMEAPITTRVRDRFDTSNFDIDQSASPMEFPPYKPTKGAWAWDKEF